MKHDNQANFGVDLKNDKNKSKDKIPSSTYRGIHSRRSSARVITDKISKKQ